MAVPVLIAGGGIGGLTLAALLHRRGRECLVLERASKFAPVGAGLVVQPNAVKALRIGGIESAIVERGAVMERLQIRRHRGRVLSSVSASRFREAFGSGVYGFHRATLHAALLDLIPASSLRLGATVASLESSPEGVAVQLETGERIEGSGVVAADGLHSVIRRKLGHEGPPRYSGYTSWRGVTQRGSHWPSGQMSESWGPGARFGLVSIDGDRLYWFATANEPLGGTEVSRSDLLRRFGDWHQPIRAVIESTPDGAILRTDIADRDPGSRWGEGRVTLLGDAAHAMTPNLGQGGCQAIEDAVVLDLCLSATPDIEAAFRDYETRRIDRTARVVTEARRLGRIGQIENAALRTLRDLAVRATPSAVTLRSLRWLYDFDV